MIDDRTDEPPELPEGLAGLGPEVTAAIRRLLGEAEERQDREAAEALDVALRMVPRPLRGVVRKGMLG